MTHPELSRRTLLAAAGATALAATTTFGAASADAKPRPGQLLRWAADTWKSLVAMTGPNGLPADNIRGDLSGRSGYTSPTNIGGYLWSTLIARDLGLIGRRECDARVAATLKTLGRMEHHRPSGMFYNWYDETDGSVLRTWPEDGTTVTPFVSSVDMGWRGAALWVVAQGNPVNKRAALALFRRLRWDVFFDRAFWRKPGANYGGFWIEDPHKPQDAPAPSDLLNGIEGPQVWYTVNHHYDTAVSEARMVNYLGIMRGQIPPAAYFATFRTFPPDWDWPEMPPKGFYRTYLGVEVYEGSHTYRGFQVVPGWGGSMFEELMPDLFVPEATWGPKSWGVNHPLHVRAQREHGLDDAKYGYWGFSPSSNPAGGYREYGVDALGLKPDGYFSDQEKTDYHWNNPPTDYGDGVVTPHSSFLAMRYEPDEAVANLTRIAQRLHGYGPGGFYDAIATESGRIAKRYLSLDQAMIMGALGNVLPHDRLRLWFSRGLATLKLRPVLALEEFSAKA